MNLMPSQVFPISFISFSTVRRHVILGRPRLRFPSGVQCIAVFAMEASWRVTWPIHHQRLLIRMVAIGSVPHRWIALSSRRTSGACCLRTVCLPYLFTHCLMLTRHQKIHVRQYFPKNSCALNKSYFSPAE